MEKRNFLVSIGVDYLPDPPHYLITFVAPIVDEDRSMATNVQSIRGATLAEAHAMISHTDAHVYSYGKLQVLVFGEEAARQGVSIIMDDMFKHTDLRVESYVGVTVGTAQKLLTTVPPEGQRIGLFLNDLLDRAAMQQDAPPTTMEIFTSRMMTPGMDAATTLLAPIGSTEPRPPDERGADGGSGEGGGSGQGTTAEDIQIVGMAAWQGDRMVGTTTLPQQQYFSIAHGTSHDFLFQLLLKPDPRFVRETNRILISIEQAKPSWDTQIIEGAPHFSLKVDTVVNLINYQGSVDLTDGDNAEELTKILAENMKQGITDALLTVSSMGSDPIGLGQFVRVQYPKIWDPKKWTDAIKTATFSVNVKLSIKRVGVYTTRFDPKDKMP